MKMTIRKYWLTILWGQILFTLQLPAQTVATPFSDFVDSSSLVVVGTVVKTTQLEMSAIDSLNTPQGVYGLNIRNDGQIYSVYVTRVLKGQNDVLSLDVITTKDDGCGRISFCELVRS